MKNAAKTAVLLAGYLATTIPLAAQTVTGNETVAYGYQMAAVSDRAYGKTILSGDYDKAIAKLSGRGNRFAASTNLCVAYAATGALEDADQACSQALAFSEREARHASAVNVHAQIRDLAIALSNQGVVKAMRGDRESAQRYFSEAVSLRTNLEHASSNLNRLQSADDARHADTEA